MNEHFAKNACEEFNRARLLRTAAARAGDGLPAIEPGMPTPAGTGLSRRSFLLRSGGFVLTVYGAMRLDALGLGEAIASAAEGPSSPVLVSVFLEGGADSLTMLAPVQDATYRRIRPTLAVSPDSGKPFADDDRLRWHPAIDSLRVLHEENKMAVAPSIGYAHADQSHFTSRHYWQVGALDTRLTTGWMGRYLDVVGGSDNPLQGLSLDYGLSPALASSRAPVAAISQPRSYRFDHSRVWGEVADEMVDSLDALGTVGANGSDPAIRQAAFATQQSMSVRKQLLPFAVDDEDKPPELTSPVTYPTGDDDFPERLQALAAMLALGLPLHCVSITAPGDYDTHDNQSGDFEKSLKFTADSLLAFQRDIEARGLQDRVLIEVWSEFGRRPEQNGSAGTDHGAAGLGMLIGSRVKRQLLGEFTGVNQLDEDSNMRISMDFRAMRGAILDQWFGFDSAQVIPGVRNFQLPSLLA